MAKKKDRNVVDELQASSTTPSVKESNKEAEKKEAELEGMRTRCKTCFKEVAPKRICGGHGGGGGGGGDSGESSEASEVEDDDTSLMTQSTEELADEFISGEDYEVLHAPAEPQLDEDSFDSKIIAALVARGLLVVDSDRESMTLTIGLKCELSVLSEEEKQALQKFMEAITKELGAFKEEKGISEDCMEMGQDEAGNILNLCIKLPTLALYDAFIQQLGSKLLPDQELDLEEDAEADKPFNPSPFSKTPWG